MGVFDRMQAFANEDFEDGSEVVTAEDASEVVIKVSEVEDPEAGVVEGEIAEIKEEIDTAERDIEELEQKAEAAEAFAEAVEAFAAEGGMEPQAARLIHTQMSSLMANCGVESYALAAENFQGTAARARNTEPALEAISDTIKKVWEFIKQIATKVWNFIKELWSKISFQAQRIKARTIKVMNAANSLKGHSADVEVKVGGNSYLYIGNDFIGQSEKGLEAMVNFLKAQSSYTDALGSMAGAIRGAAANGAKDDDVKSEITTILRTIPAITRAGTKVTQAPLSGDTVVRLPVLPGNKTIFTSIPEDSKTEDVPASIKTLRKLNSIFASDPATKTTTKKDKVKVSNANQIKQRMGKVGQFLSNYESAKGQVDSLNKAFAAMVKVNPDGVDSKATILKVVRQAVTTIRKLACGPVAGANAHILSSVGAYVNFAAREISVLAKDKKKGGSKDGKKPSEGGNGDNLPANA